MMFEAVIGLEIHVQLRTNAKLFCEDLTEPGAAPNTQVCPVCLGLPGALPVLNPAAVELAVLAALGLGCTVHAASRFERKSYFYPDLPKGYQITQATSPLATDGVFEDVRIRRIHLEEDAGRLLHDRVEDRTAIDLNRAGVPLIEIVTEPDLRDPAEARAFLLRLRRTLRYLDVSDCEMENGSLRVDANASVRPSGSSALGVRTELKNLNSFAHLERALVVEIGRQRAAAAAGEPIEPDTLLWDAARGRTQRLRRKEEGSDYRYHIDPDLEPLRIEPAMIDALRLSLPELPAAMEARFAAAYDLPRYDIEVLTAEPALAQYFESVAARVAPKLAANWIMTEVLGWLNRHGSSVEYIPVAPAALAELLALIDEGTVSRAAARQLFDRMAESGLPARELAESHGLVQVNEEARLSEWIERTIAEYPAEVARYRAGESKVIMFLMGRIMKLSGGTADPRRCAALLKARLE